jgi:5'-3' exonuclease
MARRLHLIDGTYELFRAFYSKRPKHRSADGREVKGATGVVSSLLALLGDQEEAVSHIAVAFDNPIESFRNDLFDGYKTGEGIDPELRGQFEDVEEGVRALGITVWVMDEWEADDALATATKKWKKRFDQVRIMTPDKDLGQMIEGQHIVQVDRRREVTIDEKALRTRRGVGPASIPDFLALIGDSADGIPGLPGFGEKSTSTLLGEYEHIENIPDDANDWTVKIRGGQKLAATLAERREDALFYRRLATLVTDVPLEERLTDLAFRGVPEATFAQWCQAMAADRLYARAKPLFA